MFLKAFSFLDIKTGVYSAPFFVAHKAQAIRAAVEIGNDFNTQVGRHPHDFRLAHVGEFDDNVGRLTSTEPEDYGTVAGLCAQSAGLGLPGRDPSQMTSAEVVQLRQDEREASA